MNPSLSPLLWQGDRLLILDQRKLPHQEEWLEAVTAGEVARAIRDMVVRGAPAIGIAAAYGLALEASAGEGETIPARLQAAAAVLKASRPTAINLAWAVDRMMKKSEELAPGNVAAGLAAEAAEIHEEDLRGNREIGRLGAELLGAAPRILTHCNAGSLATGGYGTALGIVRAAEEVGKRVTVFAGESRPYLQGSRLTAWELDRDDISVTLITDGMAGYFFNQDAFDAVIVGADRIAANGDTANKIGTYVLAVLAHHHGVPFYVAAPTSTVDPGMADGKAIPIEERPSEEVRQLTGFDAQGISRTVQTAPATVPTRHPAFDVTPAGLITAIITERGVARPSYSVSLAALLERP
ncbi:MAG TPA: S-methyl-5-thioribose-1-phosphate isomerase [Thermoanaerobaculia bacterium]|nr:S-methyl-5-thioribose-1-phosphate isomerase [Thermoanaerobaculia bacterium]